VRLIAGDIGVSRSYLSRVFHKHAGRTISDYLWQRRVEHAARLLRRTGWPVTAIAAACGYSSDNYLRRIFRSVYGMTPSEYRQRKPHGRKAR
jgi:AraC-like DNA-binding protein